MCCPLSEHHRACGNQSQIWTEPTSWELFTRSIGGCVEDCTAFVPSPKKIRCDANGMLLGQSCDRSCSATGTQQYMSTEEACWQVGLVEGHICVLKELLTHLYIKGCICFCRLRWKPSIPVRIYIGYSPTCWFTGGNARYAIFGGQRVDRMTS